MSDIAENSEQQTKKTRIDEGEEPLVIYATPQTLCVVANSEDGDRLYHWNQSGQLNDTEKKLIGYFLKPEKDKADRYKWDRSVSCYTALHRLLHGEVDFTITLELLGNYDKTISTDDLQSVVVTNSKWEACLTDEQFQQRTKDGELPLRVIFVNDWC